MLVSRRLIAALLIILVVAVLVLSQLSSAATCCVYETIGRALHLDLVSLGADMVRISDIGHIVAGVALGGLVYLLFRSLWVVPMTLAFFAALEFAQLFSVDRQGNLLDVARGFGGALFAWGVITLFDVNCRNQ